MTLAMLIAGDFSGTNPSPTVVLNIPPPPSPPPNGEGGTLLLLLPKSFGVDALPKYPFSDPLTAAAPVVPFNTPPPPAPTSPTAPGGATDEFPPTPAAVETSPPFIVAPPMPLASFPERSVRYPPPTGIALLAAAKPLSEDFA